MTKTQQHIMDEVSTRGRVAVEHFYGQGSHGGRVGGGTREFDAAMQLRDAGKLVEINRHSSQIYNRGYCVHVTSVVFKLP